MAYSREKWEARKKRVGIDYFKKQWKKQNQKPETKARKAKWDRDHREVSRERNQITQHSKIKNWRLHNPEKYRAQNRLRKAVALGKIQRLSCEKCNAPKTHAHHPDYSKPYDVSWLCPLHHKKAHRIA